MTEKIDKKQAERVLRELATRAERAKRLDVDELLFGPQREFIRDRSKKKAAVCSRRAGKSYGIAVDALITANENPGALVPYITLTRVSGKRIMWPPLQAMNKQMGLGAKFNNNELTVTLPNGAQIFISGADDHAEIERLRGPAYPKVYIDEAQSFRPFLKDLIKDIIEPAILDYDGQILMTGTPNAACAGAFYEATTASTSPWHVHKWTLRDNPFLPNVEQWLEERKKDYGWDDEHPTYLREYCGIWVRDDTSLVYRLNENVNVLDDSPDLDDGWDYVLGVDLGASSSTAFCVVAYNDVLRSVRPVLTFKRKDMIPSSIAATIESLQQRWKFSSIVIDSGGLGKGYVEEFRQRYDIPAEPAEKRHKLSFIELLNGDLRNGTIQIYEEENRPLLDEMWLLQWNEARTEPDKARYEDHACDAFLYAWRRCRQYLYEEEIEGPTPGTKEWYDKVEEEMFEQAVKKYVEGPDEPWWLDPYGQ